LRIGNALEPFISTSVTPPNIAPVQRVQRPVLPEASRLLLPTEYRAVLPHQVYAVLSLLVLLEYMDTERNLMLTGRATVQRILTGTEVATVGEIHAVLVSVAVLDECADFALRPKGNGDGEGTVSKTSDG
jgi:hypothetical protein